MIKETLFPLSYSNFQTDLTHSFQYVRIEYENETMLIDAGENDQGEIVTTYLQNQGISTLDYVVATHPHSDHIGGMDDILNSFQVGHFVDSGYPYTSKTYENMLTTIGQKNIPVQFLNEETKLTSHPVLIWKF